MNRPILTCVLFAFATAAVYAQQPAQSDAYQGQSNPPADDTITAQPEQPEQTDTPAKAEGREAVGAARSGDSNAAARSGYESGNNSSPSTNYSTPSAAGGTDDGIVSVAPDSET